MNMKIKIGPSGLVVIITTIQEPTASMAELSRRLVALDVPLLALGDQKGPESFNLPSAYLVSLDAQKGLLFALSPLLPEGHYARKNLGYLLAFQSGASHIYETDDDNAPLPGWNDRNRTAESIMVSKKSGWYNVYAAFTREPVWPRGFPLEEIKPSCPIEYLPNEKAVQLDAPIQQGLANGSPDVDAVWRLVFGQNMIFEQGSSIALPPGVWCPFNSQSTWWWPEAYPLMYLPSYCSFRMTDIWRSFVAQRCLWELERNLVFHAPEVVQLRNEHKLIRDFADEIPGYLNNARMIEVLNKLELTKGPGGIFDNLICCYEALIAHGWVGREEIPLLRAWVSDCQYILNNII
jgi:hypothetical protein